MTVDQYYVNNLHEQMQWQAEVADTLLTREIVIFDLDGCLAADDWRFKYILEHASNPDDKYRQYHAYSPQDVVLPHAYDHLLRHIANGSFVVFSTARPFEFKAHTTSWIAQALGLQDSYILLMRANGCEEPSFIIKRRILAFLRDVYKVKVKAAYDDRTDVCRMYHMEGISTFIANQYGLEPYHETVQPPAPIIGVRPRDAADVLQEVVKTMRERNETYKDSYNGAARILAALFPDGIKVTSVEEFARLHLIQQLASKLARAANSGFTHRDSIIDIAGYSAMLTKLIDDQGVAK